MPIVLPTCFNPLLLHEMRLFFRLCRFSADMRNPSPSMMLWPAKISDYAADMRNFFSRQALCRPAVFLPTRHRVRACPRAFFRRGIPGDDVLTSRDTPDPGGGVRQQILANAQESAVERSESTLFIPTRRASEGGADGTLARASGWYGPWAKRAQTALRRPSPIRYPEGRVVSPFLSRPNKPSSMEAAMNVFRLVVIGLMSCTVLAVGVAMGRAPTDPTSGNEPASCSRKETTRMPMRFTGLSHSH